MNKEQKKEAVKEIGAALEESSAVFAVDYRGISVPQAAELRGKLREADANFNVVKNRLAKRVTADSGNEALDEHLVGPTALTYIKGDPVVAAKAITGFIKEHEVLAYKGGIMDGQPLDTDGFKAISRLPALEVLHGQLVGLTATPLTGLVTGLNGLVQGLATQLGKIAEEGLVGGDAPAPEPEPAAEEKAEEEPAAEAEAPAAEEETSEPESQDESGDEAEEKTETTEDGPDAEADDSAEAGAEDSDEKSEESEESGDDETDTKED